MEHKLLFKTALLAGEIMLRSGAETYRVEDTINRMLQMSNFQTVDSFVTPTGIFATLDDPSIDMITHIKRVRQRSNHLNKVALVNDVSRKFCQGDINLQEAYHQLKSIDQFPTYKPPIYITASALASAFFVFVFEGTYIDFPVALINGFFIGVFQLSLYKRGFNRFFIDLIGAAVIAAISVISVNHLNFGNNFDVIIISSIMPLVPGVAITNAVRDTLHGDYLSGTSRAVEAFIVAISIAVGVGISLSMFNFFLGGSI